MNELDWMGGPVAITGAGGQVGTALRERLAGVGNEVRPLGRGDDLRDAFRRTDAVVLLAGGPIGRAPDTESADLGTMQEALEALDGSGCRRVVFLSFVTADMASDNAYLRAKGLAELVLAGSGQPAVVFRTDHIYGPPGSPGPTASAFLARGRGTVRILGDGSQRLAPVYRGDVVEAIVRAALDPSTPEGTFELAGPQSMTTDGFAQALNGYDVHVAHTPVWASRALGHATRSLTPTLVDLMLRDAEPTGDPWEAARVFGYTLHRVDEVWGVRTAEPVAYMTG